jgi:hypothetical protein
MHQGFVDLILELVRLTSEGLDWLSIEDNAVWHEDHAVGMSFDERYPHEESQECLVPTQSQLLSLTMSRLVAHFHNYFGGFLSQFFRKERQDRSLLFEDYLLESLT